MACLQDHCSIPHSLVRICLWNQWLCVALFPGLPILPSICIHNNRQKWYCFEHKRKDTKGLKWVALSAGHFLWVSESTAGPSCACITWLEVVLLSHAYVLGDRNVQSCYFQVSTDGHTHDYIWINFCNDHHCHTCKWVQLLVSACLWKCCTLCLS